MFGLYILCLVGCFIFHNSWVLLRRTRSATSAIGKWIKDKPDPVLTWPRVHCAKALTFHLILGTKESWSFASVKAEYVFQSSPTSLNVLSMYVIKSSAKISVKTRSAGNYPSNKGPTSKMPYSASASIIVSICLLFHFIMLIGVISFISRVNMVEPVSRSPPVSHLSS